MKSLFKIDTTSQTKTNETCHVLKMAVVSVFRLSVEAALAADDGSRRFENGQNFEHA